MQIFVVPISVVQQALWPQAERRLGAVRPSQLSRWAMLTGVCSAHGLPGLLLEMQQGGQSFQ